ncbi:hypothetical protein FRC08_015977 [Ceratobasidium sp. 394]|nr:hypothetical protein FRC08_015977 [Ceratobasidium sp. 394]
MVEIFVSLVFQNLANPTSEDIEMTEAAVTVITKLAGNESGRQAFYYSDAVPRIMPLLSISDLKNRLKLVTEVMHSLDALAQDEDCAYEIIAHPNFPALLAFLEPQTQLEDQKSQQNLITDTVSAIATLAETCQRRWYFEGFFARITNHEIFTKLVQILAKKKNPAINKVLGIMKIISQYRDHLLITGDTPVVEYICDSVGVSLDALAILRKFVDYDYVRGMMIEKGVVSHITGLVESKDSELALTALEFVEQLLEYNDSSIVLLKNEIVSTLATPLNSSQPKLLDAALDVALAIISRSENFDDTLVNTLVSLASKTKNHKAMLAIGGITAHQKLNCDLETLIHAFTTFMEDPDNTMVEDALNVLTKLAEHAEYREEMLQAHIVQNLSNLLNLATSVSSYYDSSNTWSGRTKITLKAFRMLQVLCTDPNIRAQLIGSSAIDTLYSLTDSPVTYEIDEAAIQTLRQMKYEDVQSVVEKLDRERGLRVLSQIRSGSSSSVAQSAEPVTLGQDEQLGKAEEPEAQAGLSRPTTATDGAAIGSPSRGNSTDQLVAGSDGSDV